MEAIFQYVNQKNGLICKEARHIYLQQVQNIGIFPNLLFQYTYLSLK